MKSISSQTTARFSLVAGGSLLCGLYAFMALESREIGRLTLSEYFGIHVAATVIVLITWYLSRNTRSRFFMFAIIFWAIAFRMIGLFGAPVLEDDFYRYLLDGCMTLATGSPYGMAPSELFSHNLLSADCREPLNWVNNPDIPTIYPPLLQYLFALASALAPGSITVLQGILVLFDLLLIVLLARIVTPATLLLYAWCPLVIKEIAFTAHPDIVGISLLFAAFVIIRSRPKLASVLIALACASKIFALIALPWFLFRRGLVHWIIIPGVIALTYLPFVLQQGADLAVLGLFADNWVFNPALYLGVQLVLDDPWARLLCLGLFATAWLAYCIRDLRPTGAGIDARTGAHNIPRLDWMFGLFFALSPVINPWYLLWILPWALLRPAVWPWVWISVVPFSYATGLHLGESASGNPALGAYQVADWAMLIQFTAVAAALVFDYLAGRLLPRSHCGSGMKMS